MSLTRRVAQNTIVQIVGKIVSTILGVVAIGMMTRMLGQDGFGAYTTIIAFLQFFGILVDFGLTITTMSMIAAPGADERRVLGNLMTFRLITATLFLALAPLTALFFPYSEEIKWGIALNTLSFLAVAVNQVLTGYFQKELRSHIIALAEIAGRIVLIALLTIAFIQNRTLLFIISAVVAGAWTNAIIALLFARSRVYFTFAWDVDIWRKIIHISWPIALSIFFNLIYLKADTIILSLFRTQSEVGLYGAPYRVLETLATFPFLFVGIVFPIFTAAYLAGDHERLQRTFQKTFDALAILALPMIAGTLVLAKPIMILVAGDEFATSGPLLQILIIATGFIFFGTLFGHLIVVAQAQKRMIIGYATTACIALAGYIAFIPLYSYWAAAWMTVIAEGTILLLTAFVALRTLHLSPQFSVFVRAGAASIAMALLLSLLHMHVLILILIGAIFYCIFLFLFRGVSKELLREIIVT